jgi:hypothetical protein
MVGDLAVVICMIFSTIVVRYTIMTAVCKMPPAGGEMEFGAQGCVGCFFSIRITMLGVDPE